MSKASVSNPRTKLDVGYLDWIQVVSEVSIAGGVNFARLRRSLGQLGDLVLLDHFGPIFG